MNELIIRSLHGRTSAAEEERLSAWRYGDPRNDRIYREVRDLWTLTGVAAPDELGMAPPNFEVLMAGAGLTKGQSGGLRRVRPASAVGWSRHAAFGGLAACLVAVGFGIGMLASGQNEPTLRAETEIATGTGEMTTVTLGDGSSIRVGPQSLLRVTEDHGRRTAWLEGRAFFGVQSDSSRPFTVRTPSGVARALGTRFEVLWEGESQEFRVLVLEGEVSVEAGGSEVRLNENEMSLSRNGAVPMIERVQDAYSHLAWIGNVLVFQATPLSRALREIEVRYGVDVTLQDPSLSNLTVSATFTGRPVEEVIFVLCEILSATCRIDGERIQVGVERLEGGS